MSGDRRCDARRHLDVLEFARRRRDPSTPGFVLLGSPGDPESWPDRVGLRVRAIERVDRAAPPATGDALRRIDGVWRERVRRGGGTSATGIAVVIAYEAGVNCGAPPPDEGPRAPDVLALAVDAAAVPEGGRFRVRFAPGERSRDLEREIDSGSPVRAAPSDDHPPRSRDVATSLPRPAYLDAVRHVRERILDGDVYQANLTQMFRADGTGDRFETFARLYATTPAPRAAFVECDGFALASVSPEVFVDATPDGRVETWPIKGTRARCEDPSADREAARELLASDKDRAELVMIVDLERNDLGRLCRPGSVRVPDLAVLRSFPAVHHLVARVTGRLRPDVALDGLLAATFPGGSITGAPKLAATAILRRLEPWRRGWFTGSLLWLGDDGSLRSSILIRSVVLDGERAWLGAGGGVVVDSDPASEWAESIAKATGPARALGFRPEDFG